MTIVMSGPMFSDENIVEKFFRASEEERKNIPWFFRDEVMMAEIDGKIVTVGENADDTGVAVYVQDGNTPAVNSLGNETGKTILEEYREGNLYAEEEGYHRGAVFAAIR